MQEIKLVCWHCDVEKNINVEWLPESAIELAGLAVKNDMVAMMDDRYRRVLIFCNREHADKQLLKNGFYPKKARKEKVL